MLPSTMQHTASVYGFNQSQPNTVTPPTRRHSKLKRKLFNIDFVKKYYKKIMKLLNQLTTLVIFTLSVHYLYCLSVSKKPENTKSSFGYSDLTPNRAIDEIQFRLGYLSTKKDKSKNPAYQNSLLDAVDLMNEIEHLMKIPKPTRSTALTISTNCINCTSYSDRFLFIFHMTCSSEFLIADSKNNEIFLSSETTKMDPAANIFNETQKLSLDKSLNLTFSRNTGESSVSTNYTHYSFEFLNIVKNFKINSISFKSPVQKIYSTELTLEKRNESIPNDSLPNKDPDESNTPESVKQENKNDTIPSKDLPSNKTVQNESDELLKGKLKFTKEAFQSKDPLTDLPENQPPNTVQNDINIPVAVETKALVEPISTTEPLKEYHKNLLPNNDHTESNIPVKIDSLDTKEPELEAISTTQPLKDSPENLSPNTVNNETNTLAKGESLNIRKSPIDTTVELRSPSGINEAKEPSRDLRETPNLNTVQNQKEQVKVEIVEQKDESLPDKTKDQSEVFESFQDPKELDTKIKANYFEKELKDLPKVLEPITDSTIGDNQAPKPKSDVLPAMETDKISDQVKSKENQKTNSPEKVEQINDSLESEESLPETSETAKLTKEAEKIPELNAYTTKADENTVERSNDLPLVTEPIVDTLSRQTANSKTEQITDQKTSHQETNQNESDEDFKTVETKSTEKNSSEPLESTLIREINTTDTILQQNITVTETIANSNVQQDKNALINKAESQQNNQRVVTIPEKTDQNKSNLPVIIENNNTSEPFKDLAESVNPNIDHKETATPLKDSSDNGKPLVETKTEEKSKDLLREPEVGLLKITQQLRDLSPKTEKNEIIALQTVKTKSLTDPVLTVPLKSTERSLPERDQKESNLSSKDDSLEGKEVTVEPPKELPDNSLLNVDNKSDTSLKNDVIPKDLVQNTELNQVNTMSVEEEAKNIQPLKEFTDKPVIDQIDSDKPAGLNLQTLKPKAPVEIPQNAKTLTNLSVPQCLKKINIDCYQYIKQGFYKDAQFKIRPMNWPDCEPVKVQCNMKKGGHTIIMRRNSGKQDFYRSWQEYKNGFGDPALEYWIGNQMLHYLTHQQNYSLLIDMQDWKGNQKVALYDKFLIKSESDGYELLVGNFSKLSTANDSFSHHSGSKFSTYDMDNDDLPAQIWNGNCAKRFHGAWWYKACYRTNLNGKWYKNGEVASKKNDGIAWNSWHGNKYSLKSVEMRLVRNLGKK